LTTDRRPFRAINDLTDVEVGTPSDNDVLTWVDANSQWEAAAPTDTQINGITASAAELNVLDGVTAGTVTASKGVVVDANKNLDTLVVTALKLGAGAGTSLTSTASELNQLHSVTAGTTAASKALVVDATKNLDALAITALSLGAAGGTAVTATAAELNKAHSLSATGYLPVWEEVTFTETANAGVYTGAVVVPAGATIVDIQVRNPALWTASTSATLKVGDGADDDGWYTGVNLEATDLLVGEVLKFGKSGGKEGAYLVQATGLESKSYNAGSVTISGVVTTVGTAGTAGRTRLLVGYVLPTAVAATKV
jgi:hypothetical protein